MHIRKLEIQGFKSFPDRTTFHFGPGISGVVGPNGCGKSNVVDAVKWCLGEQSARSLRGRSMDDVIFGGSADRSPMGLAEVTLTFAAGDEPFPGELARCVEVQVSRRLFRDGHSDYLINHQKVRLRDVYDLFLDTGAANRLYSFIEQGRIGEIVNAKPEQRRTLIEEAAGISRFKARADEAEEKLRETLNNLERATDVVDGLAQRLRSLGNQVGKAVRHRRLRARIRQVEVALGLIRFAALAADRKALTNRVRDTLAEETTLTRAVERREEEVARGREAIDVLETAVGRSRDRLAELEATRREQESARQYQDRELAQLRVRVEELAADCRRNETERGAAAARQATAQQEREAGERTLASDQAALDASRNRLQQTETEVRNRRVAVDGLKARILTSARALAQDEAALGAARQRLAELQAEAERVAGQGDEAGADLHAGAASVTAAGDALREAQERLAEREKALQLQVEAVRLGEVEAGRLRGLAGAAEQARALIGREEVGIRARRDAIRLMHERHEGMGEALQAALRAPGARGTVAEHLDVPVALEAVLAMALGQALDHVLVESVDAALLLVGAAKGRVGVLLVDDVARALPSDWAAVGGSPLGLRALAQLLDGTAIAAGVSEALAERVRGVDQVVGGDQPARVGWRGEVAVGRPEAVGTAVLARRRQLGELEAQLIDAVERLAGAQAAADASTTAAAAASAGLDQTRKARESGREAAADAAIQVRECTRELDQRQRQHQRDAERVDRVARDRLRLDDAQAQTVARLADLGASVRKRGDEQALVETELHAAQQELAALDSALTAARDDAARRAAAFAGLKERLLGVRRAEAEAAGVAEAAGQRVERAQAETEAARRRIGELGDDDKRLAALLQALGEEQATLRTRLEEEREHVRIGRVDLTRNEDALADTRGRREQASLRRLEAEREVARVRDELARIRDQLEERYEVNVTGLLDRLDRNGQVILEADADARDPGIELPDGVSGDLGPAPEDLRIVPANLEDSGQVERWLEQLQKDRAALTRLGEVNLVALQEYTEVAARHAALEAQRADLDESVRTIRQTVAKLHRLCRERFRETFDLVDGFFRETYPRLVGGGKARLFLTNEDDLLVTGVDIEVQPPGKRLQSLGLMSGGETAMVAIALIFSLFRVKPSPFCLLDEVDAPLDEGNGARFNVMLREMSARSQFIVITHNKKTMECADTLYGVTMAAPGVSRLVSVQLD